MTDAQKVIVLREAIYMVSKALREHPFDMDWHFEDPERIQILAGGTARDPEGKEWANYFVKQAHKKLVEEGVITIGEDVH